MEITQWQETEKAEFLLWLRPPKTAKITFLIYPRVSILLEGEKDATTYLATNEVSGFKIDAIDHLSPKPSDEEGEDTHGETIPTDPNIIDYGSAFDVFYTPKQLDEMMAEYLSDFVKCEDHEAAKQKLEELFFLHSASMNFNIWDKALSDPNPGLFMWVTGLAGNHPIAISRSQQEIAERCQVTRAQVSKKLKQIRKKYGLHSRSSKSEAARASYSDHKKLNQ